MILHREAEEPWLLLFTKAATLCSLVLVMALLWLRQASAGPVTVRFVEGVTHVSLCCIRLTGSPLQPAISSKFSGADKSRVAWYSASRTGCYMTKEWCSLKSESLPPAELPVGTPRTRVHRRTKMRKVSSLLNSL